MSKYIVLEWNKLLGNYLIRWRVDFYFFSIRLHKWLCSDDERAYHDHPVNFLIFILSGHYIDHYLVDGKEYTKHYKAGMLRVFRRNYKHYVEIIDSPTYTLLITWGLPKRWGFWLKNTLKHKKRDKYFIEHGHHICDHN